MKKILILCSALFALLAIQGCWPPERYDIVDIRFTALGEQNSDGKTIIEGALQFSIHYELEFQRRAYNYMPKLVQDCYATSIGQVFDNKLLYDTFSLSFDKDFTFQNTIIEAGTNVLEILDIKNEMTIYEKRPQNGSIWYYSTRIEFSQFFMDNSVFEDDYRVDFSCETSDDRAFQKSTTIVFLD